jgi:hypothetical protein
VWQPESGFTKATDYQDRLSRAELPGAFIAALVHCPWPSGDVPLQSRYGADDWALLEICNDEISAAAPSIHGCAEPKGGGISVVGYPGGSSHWKAGEVIRPMKSLDFRVDKQSNGVLILHGPEEVRAGMSGGGVFNAEGHLVGLHRSSIDSALQNRAVSAVHVRDQLSVLGYEWLVPQDVHDDNSDGKGGSRSRRWWILSAVLSAILAIIVTITAIVMLQPSRRTVDASDFFSMWQENTTVVMQELYVDKCRLKGACKIKEVYSTHYILYRPVVMSDGTTGWNATGKLGWITVDPTGDIPPEPPAPNSVLHFEGNVKSVTEYLGVFVSDAKITIIEPPSE